MEATFAKYQGAGNDFVIFDDREGRILPLLSETKIARLCDRRFGIGADGLMLLAGADAGFDFRMIYYNADGRESTLCGNGGRCIVDFARRVGIERTKYRFVAIDGPHDGEILADGSVALGMNPVRTVRELDGDFILDTGSPHYLRFVSSLEEVDVVATGRSIRRSAAFAREGINVNFVEAAAEDGLLIATYERGVEDETLACGTGVTAAAVGHLFRSGAETENPFHVRVRARGGDLAVTGRREGDTFTDLCLIGPATYVFSGTVTI